MTSRHSIHGMEEVRGSNPLSSTTLSTLNRAYPVALSSFPLDLGAAGERRNVKPQCGGRCYSLTESGAGYIDPKCSKHGGAS